MKHALLLAMTFLALGFGNAQTNPESTSVILTSAKEQASKEKKNIFLIFHASWCGWCHKMDTALNDPKVKKYFQDQYVFRHLVVNEYKEKKQLENPGAQELMEQFGGKQEEGIPFWAVLDANGHLLADSRIDGQPGKNSGCPAKKEEVDYFIKVLQKTSNLDASALDIIGKRFRENDL